MDQDLISCLCVTKNRVALLRRAVSCFAAQTYANKELIVVYEDNDVNTKEYLAQISNADIKLVQVPSGSGLSLGALRNLSIEKCNGDYFCQWDDDDWYHQNRLELQMEVIKKSGFPACVLMHWLVFDSTSNSAYISPFWHWEGSLLCAKKALKNDIRYDDLKRGEDTGLIKKLFKKHAVFPVMAPKLYIYVYHSKNTWEYDHWSNNIIQKGKALSTTSSLLIKDILDDRYSVQKASMFLDDIKQ